jgi:hypothetical protein
MSTEQPKPEALSYDYPVVIPASVYALLESILNTGKLSHSGVEIDFSPVQEIKIANGKAQLNPPARVSLGYGGVAIRTTVSALVAQAGGVKIEIDNSPINVEVRPG